MTAKLDENTVTRSAVEALLQAAILIAAGESFAKIDAGAYLGKKVLEGCLRAVGLGRRADAADGAVVAAGRKRYSSDSGGHFKLAIRARNREALGLDHADESQRE